MAAADQPGVTAPAPIPALPERPEGADPYPRWPLKYGAYGFVIGIGSGIAALIVLAGPLAVISWGWDVDTDDSLPVLELVATFFQDIGWIVGAVMLAAKVAPPKAWHFGFRRARIGPAAGWSAVAIASYIALALIYTAILQPDSGDPIDTGERYGTMVGSIFIIVVVAPVCEEIFFRGFLYRIMRGRIGLWPALVINGSLFGSVHLAGGGPLAVALIAPLGFLLCLVYERSGSLYPCIALHALNNSLVSASEFEEASEIALLLGAALLVICLLGSLFSPRSETEPAL
jgi:membrane protease YdiL (CAAX protease family)